MAEHDKKTKKSLFARMETDIQNYRFNRVEISDGVQFSQYDLIKRIYRFRNRDLGASKINEDLSYNYYYDMISPRADAEVKNLRFDTKHILIFSNNPIGDFPAVFVSNAMLKDWMAENGEDEKLKTAVEEFVANGNIGFKKVEGGYELIDAQNTYITNQTAEHISESDIIERHEMTASEMYQMRNWDTDAIDYTVEYLDGKTFTATNESDEIESSSPKYEVFEFTGETSEQEYNEAIGEEGGDPNKYFLAKVIVAGLEEGDDSSDETVLFHEKINGDMEDYYIYAHRGRYEGRFWRVGMYELLFDHQVRANEIGNQLARGLDWASRSIFRSKDTKVLQNIRADMDNGDVVITEDLAQVDVRMRGLDQLIADWNRLMGDADRLTNSFEIVRGESLPAGTPFRLGALMDQNAGMFFTFLRQKLTLPYKRVFRDWVLDTLIKDLKEEEIFNLVGDTDVLDQLREMMVNKWYMENLIELGPHTKEVAEAIKAEKLDELRRVDPTIKNSQKIWEGVNKRLFITITGENSDLADQVTDLVNLVSLETDPERRAWILDQVYRIRNIPIPPRRERQPAETQLPNRGDPTAQVPPGNSPPVQETTE